MESIWELIEVLTEFAESRNIQDEFVFFVVDGDGYYGIKEIRSVMSPRETNSEDRNSVEIIID